MSTVSARPAAASTKPATASTKRWLQRMVVGAALCMSTAIVWAQDQVVYHINDTSTQALAALRNIRNHLDTEPNTQIRVVAHAFGVDFLMQGMKDRSEQSFDSAVIALHNRGVIFEVCEITLKNRNLDKAQFLEEVDFTPSGVVRLTKLQREGYAYIRP